MVIWRYWVPASVVMDADGVAAPPSGPAAELGSVPSAYSMMLVSPSLSGSAEFAAFPVSVAIAK